MQLRRNIIANYFGQGYVALLNVGVVPLYLGYLGPESYGLVAFFSVLQGWFVMLDLGLSQTVSREAARYAAGAIPPREFRAIFAGVQRIFLILAAVGSVAIAVCSGVLSTKWLKIGAMSATEVERALALMGMIAALRWLGGLYRGLITGHERLVWLNSFNIAVATIRFLGALPVLHFGAATSLAFFIYQLLVAAAELVVLAVKAYSFLPSAHHSIRMQSSTFRHVLKFSMSLSLTSAIWVLVTQLDKLLLSTLLPLPAYGQYTVATLAASGVTIITTSITGALIPRLTSLNAAADVTLLYQTYRNATRTVAGLVFPAAAICALFPGQILWAWTGDVTVSREGAPVLALYACGNAVLAVSGFPYFLQLAKGDLRLHVIGNLVFVSFLIPAIYIATKLYGAVGAAAVWLGGNLAYFILWTPLVHRRILLGLHLNWVGAMLPSLMATSLCSLFLLSHPPDGDRLCVAIQLACAGLGLVAINMMGYFFPLKLYPAGLTSLFEASRRLAQAISTWLITH